MEKLREEYWTKCSDDETREISRIMIMWKKKDSLLWKQSNWKGCKSSVALFVESSGRSKEGFIGKYAL